MKFIRELVEDVEYLKEEKDGKTALYISGPFAQAEVANRNKRFYPLSVLEKEVGRYVNEHVTSNRAYGELGHPQGPSINLDRTCILIKELKRDGNNFMGKAKVTSTPMGQIVEGLINDGAKLGVSTRALGSLKQRDDGINEVQDDLKLLAVDVVADPSAPDAYVAGLMEGADWIWDAATGVYARQTIEKQHKENKQRTQKQIDEIALYQFQQFLKTLSQ